MVKKTCLLLSLYSLIFTSICSANTTDSTLKIQAKLSPSSTPINHSVQLKVDLFYNTQNLKFKLELPKLDENFSISSRTQAKSLKKMNGNIEIKHTYMFQLHPKTEGNISIPPIRATIDQDVFETETLYLTVTKASDVPNPSKPNTNSHLTLDPKNNDSVILEAIVNTKNIYLGEKISYTLRLLRKRNYWNTIEVAFPAFEKAWTQEQENKKSEYIIERNGSRYYAYELLHKHVAPLESGDYIIHPATIAFSSGPFSPTQKLFSKTTSINVMALPENAHPNFNGAVGEFTLKKYFRKRNAPSKFTKHSNPNNFRRR